MCLAAENQDEIARYGSGSGSTRIMQSGWLSLVHYPEGNDNQNRNAKKHWDDPQRRSARSGVYLKMADWRLGQAEMPRHRRQDLQTS